jgi:hypothetical protein
MQRDQKVAALLEIQVASASLASICDRYTWSTS